MKKFFFIIALGLGGYAVSAAQTAATTSSKSAAPQAACCQKGGEAKACCAKDSKSASTTQCSGHTQGDQKAEAAPVPASRVASDRKAKTKTTTKTSSL